MGGSQVLQALRDLCAVQFQGHPKLAGHSIGHLFCNHVTLKHISLVKTKVMGIQKDLDLTTSLANKLQKKHGVGGSAVGALLVAGGPECHDREAIGLEY